MAEVNNCCGVKIWYLHIKGHYFLLQAALSAIVPLLHVFGKQLGISAVSVGFIFATLPFLSVICKPLVGWIADYTKRLKLIVYILLAFIAVSSTGLVLIPKQDRSVSGHVHCDSEGTVFSYGRQANPECVENIPLGKEYYCFMMCTMCSSGAGQYVEDFSNDSTCTSSSVNSNMNMERNNSLQLDVFTVKSFHFDSRDLNLTCAPDMNYKCNTTCAPPVHDCYDVALNEGAAILPLSMYIMFVVIINLSAQVSGTLADAACFNVLGDRVDLYGKQRLWATIGWGTFSPIVGFINYALTGSHFLQSYYGGFLCAPFLLLLDFLFLKNIEMDNLSMSKNIRKDMANLLRKAEVILFIISAFLMGSLIGVLWTFLYWHLKMLGASVLLLGFVPAFECLVGEMPFFYFASRIISRIGHFNALTICFFSFGVRYLAVSYLVNPWWVLPIGILQGPTFGLFYATMATYANFAALPGTEATMQGLIGGVYEGLGIATGSLVGGFVMEKYQGSKLFFGAGLFAFACCIPNMIFTLFLKMQSKRVGSRSRITSPQSPSEETNFI